MALKYPDRIESNNPQAYGIVKATEVSGARNAAEYGGLLDIPDNILSANGDGSDALYLLWIDNNSVYRLIDWNNRHNTKGWRLEYAYIPWDSTAHLNSFTLSGQYYLTGQSNGFNGGLPILNSGPGHTFDAILRVLDSSLTKDADLKLLCITLILSLSNRMGGDGHIFVRTIQTSEKDNLTRTDIESPTCDKWGTWEKLLGIFEKNAVENAYDLDTYTTNGMYSGVFMFSGYQQNYGVDIIPGNTFLVVTVNGYAVAKAGLTPQLTQMLYLLPAKTGSEKFPAKMYIRTAWWNASAKGWIFANWDKITTASDISKLNDRLDTAEATIASALEQLNEVREAAVTDISVDGDAESVNITVENTLTHSGGALKFPNADVRSKKAGVVTGTEINALYEIDFAAADVTNIGFEKDAEKNKITLTGIGQLGSHQSGGIELTPATSELAGLMSAADKIKLGTVESTANSAKSAAENAQTKNTEQDARLDNIEARIEPDIAGRVWNEDNGTPKAESYYGSVKALRDLPKRLGLGRYLVKDDRTRRKLHPNDSHKYLDGTPAALDGTQGQCMWCWEGFYANIWHEGSRLIKAVTFDGPVGNDISIWIPAGGISWLGAGVIDRGDAPYTDKTKWKLCSVINNSEQFRGGGGTALDASKYTKAPADTTSQITMLGMPATNKHTTDFGTYARKRGNGWEANWFVARFVVEFLFEIIMGTENSQEAFNANKDANGLYQGGFGTGVTDMPDWYNYNGSHPVIPTSVGLEAGDGVCLVEYKLPQTNGVGGDTYKTFNVPVFFGLVGAGYGHLWQWVRGLIMNAGEEQSLVYVSPSMYAAYDPNIVTDKIMMAECPRVSGLIKRKSYKGLCCMPTDIGGSSTLRYSDQFSTNAETSKGLRVRAAGGSANDGTRAGASCANAIFTAENAYANYSAPLCYFEEDPIIPDSQSIVNK